MYPNLYYAFRELFGVEWPVLRLYNTAGFFVACAFIPAAWFWKKNMLWREKQQVLKPRSSTVTINKPLTYAAIAFYSIPAFIAGYKIPSIFSSSNITGRVFSWQGSLITGIAALLLCVTWLLLRNKQLKQFKQETHATQLWPHETVWPVIMIAAITGVIGSKLSGMLEEPQVFFQSPVQALLSTSGFSFYGGLILASIVIWFYYSTKGINPLIIADCMSPSFMIAYGVGRLGCHIAGDGDWGITNLQAKPYNWLPDWLWAYNYPHNTIRQGVYIQGCDWNDFCYQLAAPVYPTPVYEAFLSFILFMVLYLLHKKIKYAGQLWALYLFLNGVERFSIEQIRVNASYHIGSINVTQGEVFAVLFMITGILLWLILPRLRRSVAYPARAVLWG